MTDGQEGQHDQIEKRPDRVEEQAVVVPSDATQRRYSVEERKASLARSVANEVRNAWNVQSQTDFQAVMHKGKRTSHGVHIFLSIVTVGLWLPVWGVIWYMNRDQSEVIDVDEYGHVNISK